MVSRPGQKPCAMVCQVQTTPLLDLDLQTFNYTSQLFASIINKSETEPVLQKHMTDAIGGCGGH